MAMASPQSLCLRPFLTNHTRLPVNGLGDAVPLLKTGGRDPLDMGSMMIREYSRAQMPRL